MARWLIPLQPFRDLDEIKKEIDDIFVTRLHRRILKPMSGCEFVLAVDLLDTKDRIVVKVEVPGVDKKDMTISISDDELMIKGEVKKEQEVNEKDYYQCERTYGSFTRTIVLPATVDKSKTKASYKDGVLGITLPKSEAAKLKEIKLAIE